MGCGINYRGYYHTPWGVGLPSSFSEKLVLFFDHMHGKNLRSSSRPLARLRTSHGLLIIIIIENGWRLPGLVSVSSRVGVGVSVLQVLRLAMLHLASLPFSYRDIGTRLLPGGR